MASIGHALYSGIIKEALSNSDQSGSHYLSHNPVSPASHGQARDICDRSQWQHRSRHSTGTLLSKYADKFDIRAGVRNPDKADKLKLPGVTVVKAEMGTADLKETFKGVDALYIVTPGADNRMQLTVATAEAAKEAGVKFLLVVSVLLKKNTDIDILFIRQFTEIEAKITALGVFHCFFRLATFTENLWSFKDSIKSS